MIRHALIIPNIEFFVLDGPHLCSRPIVSDITIDLELDYAEFSKFAFPL